MNTSPETNAAGLDEVREEIALSDADITAWADNLDQHVAYVRKEWADAAAEGGSSWCDSISEADLRRDTQRAKYLRASLAARLGGATDEAVVEIPKALARQVDMAVNVIEGRCSWHTYDDPESVSLTFVWAWTLQRT